MSKNHNYRQYSKPTDETKVEMSENIEEEKNTEELVDTAENTKEQIEPEPEKTQFIGVVTNCVKLNVRKHPNVNSEIVCTVDLCSELLLDLSNSTNEFYKVCTEAGLEGYCMKEFVAEVKS